MDSALPLVSLVCSIPDDDTLANFHGALFRVLRGLGSAHRFEILYSAAGKSEGDSSAIDSLAQLDPRIRRLSSPAADHDSVLRVGLAQATGDMLVMLDAGVHSPEILSRLLELAKGPCAWIEGVSEDHAARNRWLSWMRRDQATPSSGVLLLKRAALDALRKSTPHAQSVREWLRAEKLPRAELSLAPATHAESASTAPLLRRIIADVHTSWKTSPFTLVAYFGAMVFVVGVFLAFWFSLQGAFAPNTVWFSWCYLIVLMHILGGGILVAVGKLGALTTRILEQLQHRPDQTQSTRPGEKRTLRPPSRDAA